MRESLLVMTLILTFSVLSFFLTKTEKDRQIASGVKIVSPIHKVPAGYQK